MIYYFLLWGCQECNTNILFLPPTSNFIWNKNKWKQIYLDISTQASISNLFSQRRVSLKALNNYFQNDKEPIKVQSNKFQVAINTQWVTVHSLVAIKWLQCAWNWCSPSPHPHFQANFCHTIVLRSQQFQYKRHQRLENLF